MKKISKKLLTALILFVITGVSAFAYSGDISINQQNITFSNYDFAEGKTVRIYATVTNHSQKDLLGIVRFFDNGSQINGDQAISIFAGRTDDVFIDWSPSYGGHKIAVKIYPWDSSIDDPSNNWVVSEIFAIQDTDHDGIPNEIDDDDDGDGVPDSEDAFPLNKKEQYDTDGDGMGNNADPDNDNDEIPDDLDAFPLDPTEWLDTDKDDIGDNSDTDDDGDNLSDAEEINIGTDPLNPDTDEDGVNDGEDPFPLDPTEWLDTDGDEIGNNLDTDDDNDGISDEEDEFPLNKGPVIKLKEENFTIGLLENKLFDATSSHDEDGKIVSYVWEIDNQTKEGNSIYHKFKKLGEQTVKLTVTDDSGESRTTEFQVSIVNVELYKNIGLIIAAIALALIIFFKYIADAKNPKKTEKSK
jgi:hypothetical protein